MIEVKAVIGLQTQHGQAVDRQQFEDSLSRRFVGATVNYGRGLWEGKWEDNATVVVACESKDAPGIISIFRGIGRDFDQTAVYINFDGLVTIEEC